jgi:hypothetical protein
MGTGKQRISTAARLAGLRRPIDPVAVELEHDPAAELGLPIGPVAALELEHDPAVVELGLPIGLVVEPERAIGLAVAGVVKPTVLVAAELGLPIGLVVVPELETAQVVAPELELVQVAVALRTRSVTAAHRPDLVPLLEAEEDLVAAVAETTLEPVAAEAAIAWAAAE